MLGSILKKSSILVTLEIWSPMYPSPNFGHTFSCLFWCYYYYYYIIMLTKFNFPLIDEILSLNLNLNL